MFDENFLMVVATFGALAMGEYLEAISVMVLYRIGEYFQNKAVAKSRRSIAGLMDIRPDYANIEVRSDAMHMLLRRPSGAFSSGDKGLGRSPLFFMPQKCFIW